MWKTTNKVGETSDRMGTAMEKKGRQRTGQGRQPPGQGTKGAVATTWNWKNETTLNVAAVYEGQ